MDRYKTPQSDLVSPGDRPFTPVKALFIGLGYSIVLSFIVSMIWLVVAGFLFGFDLLAPDLDLLLSKNHAYMISDLLISAPVLFVGGRATANRTPGKEMLFGFILASVTVLIYLYLSIITDAFSLYPLVYNLLALVIATVAIILGAKSSVRN